jgi:hypothetical protein
MLSGTLKKPKKAAAIKANKNAQHATSRAGRSPFAFACANAAAGSTGAVSGE